LNKYVILIPFLLIVSSRPVRADMFGGDLPLLAQIVTNTLHTMWELQRQTGLLKDEMKGINERIYRIETIADVVQPSQWDRWKNPAEAMRRIKTIYHTLPKEYRSEKSDQIEEELSKAMNLIARVSSGSQSSFQSGKQMEERATNVSPGVAEKLTASGVGTLISMEAQTQIIQSHIVSLLAQTLADANEKESRLIESNGTSFSGVSKNLVGSESSFSNQALTLKAIR